MSNPNVHNNVFTPSPLQPPRPPKKHRFRTVCLAIIGGVVLAFIAIGLSGVAAKDPSGFRGGQAAPTATATAQPQAVLTTAPAAPPVPAGPASTFSNGQYHVGDDIVAGTYRTAGPDTEGLGMCYTERDRDGSGDFAAIISNDVSPGPKTITVKKGEYVKATGCQPFTKVG